MAKVKYENIMQNWNVHIPGMSSKIEDFYSKLGEEWNKKQTGLGADWEDVGGQFMYMNHNYCNSSHKE